MTDSEKQLLSGKCLPCRSQKRVAMFGSRISILLHGGVCMHNTHAPHLFDILATAHHKVGVGA